MKKNIKKIINKSIFLVFIALISIVNIKATYSSTQGSSGATSTGTLDIQLVLADVVQISDLNDLFFSNWDTINDMESFDDLCVYSNTSGGGYNITAKGSGAGFAFEVTDGSDNIAYNAYWNDESGTDVGRVQLSTNVALTGQTGADTSKLNCTSGANLRARISIIFPSANLSAATGAIYNGTLTFDIAPE